MAYKFQLGDARLSGSTTFEQALVGESTFSASNAISGLSLDIEKGADFNAGGLTNAGAVSGVSTLDATGLASLDGGIDVNGNMTVSTAGAIAGATTISGSSTLSGISLTTNAAVISNLGAVSGVTTLAASGLLSVASISMDDGSTLGPDSVSDLVTLSADGDITVKDGAYDFDIAAHDGTNGLKLGGVLVDASAADLNFTNVAVAGTAEASKALVLDAASDITGINNLTASYFSGNGSGITNIDVGNLDAAGSDKFLQFNQNGEFAANAGLQYSGTGSVVVSGSSSGMQSGEIAFGTAASKIGQIYVEDDGGYVMMLKNQEGGIDMSASNGVAVYLPDGQGFDILNAVGMDFALSIKDAMSDNEVAYMSGSGEISGSAIAKFTGLNAGDGNFTVNKLGALTIANSLASLDGGINVNDAFTVSTAGAVVGNEFKTDGNEFVVSTDGLVTATGIANSNAGMTAVGSIAGATTISGSGNLTLNGGITTDGAIYGVAGLKATDGYGVWTNQLTRSAGDLNIQLHDAGANSVNFRLAGGNMPLKVLSTGIVQMDATRVAIGTTAGEISGSGALKMGGAVQLDGADNSVAFVVADDMYFRDAGTGQMRRDSWTDVVSATAGTGLTATAGVLSLSQTSTPTAFASYATLVEGLNYQNSTALTGATVLTLPAASALDNGEFVKIKLGAGASSSNLVTINVGDASDSIDGNAAGSGIVLESPYAAVDLYRVAANTWRIL